MIPAASVTAVIPVHNRADLLSKLLATMRAQAVPFARILVVDNASTDGAALVAREAGCEVIAMSANTGFARAVNAGWRACNSDWIAILNSDVELAPDWIERLLNELNSVSEAAFAVGATFDTSRREIVDGTYDLISRACCGWRAGYGKPLDTSAEGSRTVVLAPGTACVWRRSVLEELGGFDEGFESYLEDLDLGLRSLCAGYSGRYVPAAKAWHHGSATLGRWNKRIVRLTARNQLRLVARHYDPGLAREWWWAILIGQLLWGLVALRHGAFRAWCSGKYEGLRELKFTARPSNALRRFIAQSEAEIAVRARDPYWKLYFFLTSRRPRSAGERAAAH